VASGGNAATRVREHLSALETMATVTGKPKARELNNVIRYTMWSVFKVENAAR
jgi:hypothetical protein